jgi:hypothetical protein
MKMQLLVTAALLAAAAPSAAATFTFSKASGGTSNSAFLDASAGGRTIRATGVRYTVAPTSLTNTSQFTGTAAVSQTSNLTTGGVGVNSENSITDFPAGAGGNDPIQNDTDGASNEALRFELLNPNFGTIRINSVTLSSVDPNDTFRIYRLGTAGALNLISFGGDIAGTGANAFTGGTATYLSGSGTNQQWRIDFQPFSIPADVFYLTARNDTADGYRVVSIDASIVPEPQTWALMIIGFGLVGITSRRRKAFVAA